MDISTGSWFEYLREEVLTEGLRDIGLPENIIDFIENAMPNAPEKSKMYAGNQWKNFELSGGYVSRPQEFWTDFMKDNFRDQIQMDSTDGAITARTVTPYSTGDPDRQREQYDEETIKQNKMIAFVVQNVKAAIGKPCGTWRKSFMKALKSLSKSGVPSEKVEGVKEFLQEFTISEFRRFWNNYDELFSWLNDEPTNYEMIKGEDNLDSAYNIANEDLLNREDPEQVMHQFDDGSYWYNLDVSNCAAEGERMGHCGGDTRGVLVSLRKRQGKRKASSSYITMTWDDETLYQIKGRNNDAPPEEMWDHIDWFIKNANITSVEEAGEHSNDHDGFQEMNDYLSTRNRDVNFTAQIDEAAIQEAVDEVVNDYEGENSSIDGEVNGPDDHGGDGVYVYMNANCSIQIELGWKGFELRNNEFTPTLGPSDTTQDDRFVAIPENTWGTDAREFLSETEIEEIENDLPGEGEVEYHVRMLEGVHPPDYEGDPGSPGPQTAVLEIEIRTSEQEDASDEETAKQNMVYFGESVRENFEDNYEELHENIRSKLAELGYASKTPYDRERAGMTEMDLDNWKIYQDGPKLEFWFRHGFEGTGVNTAGGDLGSVPNVIKMWGFDEAREGHLDGIYRKMFGSPSTGRPLRIENDDLSRNMARNLEKLYSAQEAPAVGQQSLSLGDRYKSVAPMVVLAKDSRFIIMPETTLKREQYPAMLLNWKYEIGVGGKSSTEEVEIVKDIVKYFNEHPDMVEEAAAATIRSQMEGHVALADATKSDVMSGKWVQSAIQNIDSQNASQAASGSDEWAERKIMIAKWIKENFDQMGEVEKWVAWYKFLKPLKEGYFNMANRGDVEMDDSANTGRPESWSRQVKEQMKKLGTWDSTVRNYAGVPTQEPLAGALGEPRAVEESVEQQIDRIDALLNEADDSYDLRIYNIKIGCVIDRDNGGSESETATEIRGCTSVTTVRPVAASKRPVTATSEYVMYDIKFELMGSQSRVEYRDQILLPSMRRIKGLKLMTISSMHRINRKGTIRTVRESKVLKEYGFGAASSNSGLAGQLGAVAGRNNHGSSPNMKTPRPTIQTIIDDWSEGGVKIYDVPTDHGNSAHHVMMPTEELISLMGSIFRGPKDIFDGGYQDFIANGAQAPVYLAVGQNGRCSVTGNEDLIWYAKKSGLENLPVFISYQRQV